MAVDLGNTLRNWARLAILLRVQTQKESCNPHLSFRDSLTKLMNRAQALREIEFRELADIVERSRARLMPLGEPMEHTFGINRWLVKAQEEAYSDWLGSLFEQMTAEELVQVLGLPDQSLTSSEDAVGFVRVKREVYVEHGHEDRSGRLDLLIYIGNYGLVAIEVKIGPAEYAVTVKQEGYYRAIEDGFKNKRKYYILLVTSPDAGQIHKFRVLGYSMLCRNLRRLATQWMANSDSNRLFAAAIALLAVAAIETNLLRFSLQKESFTPATLSHLCKFTEESDYERVN